MGDKLLVGDFNACAGIGQSTFIETKDAMFREVGVDEMGLRRCA